ncbi:MAG: hypothetical protein NTW86_22345 [Candidatus Sumerlaeota bacterium]|nr:hypothetical protein [Candidatus Sumerlaeota bacterium]
MVVAYRVSALTYEVGRRLAHVRFIALPNILLHERIVPEFCQRDVTPERLADETLSLLDDEPRAAAMRRQFQTLRALLGTEGAIERAAERILEEASQAHSRRGAAAP